MFVSIGDTGNAGCLLCSYRTACIQFGNCGMSFWRCFLLKSGSKWQRVTKPCLWPQCRGKPDSQLPATGWACFKLGGDGGNRPPTVSVQMPISSTKPSHQREGPVVQVCVPQRFGHFFSLSYKYIACLRCRSKKIQLTR